MKNKMIDLYNKIKRKIRILFVSFLLSLSNIEVQLFKSMGTKSMFSGGITKMLIRSHFLEKLFQGKHDEQYVKKFYEILKKSDEFMRKSKNIKMGTSADTYAKTYGKKDKYGRRYEHFGFFDEKHKHHGKTLQEVIEIELEERRTKDDDYKLLRVINNIPTDVGLSKISEVVKEIKHPNGKIEYIVDDISNKSKQHSFPIQVVREGKCVNKIEELSEFLHIKLIAFEHRRFEFFIPLKFKTNNFGEGTSIYKDILNIKEIYIRDDYGELTGYSVTKFVKRFKHNDMYDVFRFDGFEMEKI